jgi:hypothetical protein
MRCRKTKLLAAAHSIAQIISAFERIYCSSVSRFLNLHFKSKLWQSVAVNFSNKQLGMCLHCALHVRQKPRLACNTNLTSDHACRVHAFQINQTVVGLARFQVSALLYVRCEWGYMFPVRNQECMGPSFSGEPLCTGVTSGAHLLDVNSCTCVSRHAIISQTNDIS